MREVLKSVSTDWKTYCCDFVVLAVTKNDANVAMILLDAVRNAKFL